MNTANIRGKVYLDATCSVFSRLLLCIVLSHPLWCEAQQNGPRQKPKTMPRQFSQPATGPNQSAGEAALQQGVNQTGTQPAASPVAGDVSRASPAPATAQTQLASAKTNKVIFTDQMGGTVFSSGTEDVLLTILPHSSGPHPPGEKLWTDARTTVNSSIYLVSPGPERFIGNNVPGGVSMNLGKLPAGEIIFAIKTFDGFTFQNGGADRNFDNVIHAFTRTFPAGQVEVWFEDSAVNGGRRDNDMDDVAIRLSGGVRGSGPWADLQKIVDQQSAGNRDLRNAPATAKP
jgi:hypothetical protein